MDRRITIGEVDFKKLIEEFLLEKENRFALSERRDELILHDKLLKRAFVFSRNLQLDLKVITLTSILHVEVGRTPTFMWSHVDFIKMVLTFLTMLTRGNVSRIISHYGLITRKTTIKSLKYDQIDRLNAELGKKCRALVETLREEFGIPEDKFMLRYGKYVGRVIYYLSLYWTPGKIIKKFIDSLVICLITGKSEKWFKIPTGTLDLLSLKNEYALIKQKYNEIKGRYLENKVSELLERQGFEIRPDLKIIRTKKEDSEILKQYSLEGPDIEVDVIAIKEEFNEISGKYKPEVHLVECKYREKKKAQLRDLVKFYGKVKIYDRFLRNEYYGRCINYLKPRVKAYFVSISGFDSEAIKYAHEKGIEVINKSTLNERLRKYRLSTLP